MPEYRVEFPVRIQGVKHPLGETVTLDEERAMEMVLRGVLSPMEPEHDNQGLQDLVKAIYTLPPDHPDSWTGSGAPQVKALEEIVGRPVSSKERDAAWDLVRGAES